MQTTHALRRAAAIVGALLLTLAAVITPSLAGAQDATPAATPAQTYSCDDIRAQGSVATPDAGTPQAATPMAQHEGHMTGPMMEFDLMYIDMMIPHHESIMAMAQAALPELTDERLITIAQNIIAAQGPEIERLRELRQEWYGSAEPMPMDDQTMAMMHDIMPGMGGMMMTMMDADALVATFCAQPDPDIAFIDLTIPHHQDAIVASEAALQQATHPELVEIAQAVIDVQQAEIEELRTIREELTGDPNPATVTPATPTA